jgi:hypothetical protein
MQWRFSGQGLGCGMHLTRITVWNGPFCHQAGNIGLSMSEGHDPQAKTRVSSTV